MDYKENVLETIGSTPLVKMNRITKEIPALVLAKVETFNPGNSVKDRMALQMVVDAEKEGKIKPGGTIIEGTSGNTGMGLALACIAKGYKLICTLSDKQSVEKMDILRAVGAEVIVCPTNVSPDDPRSYYSVARKLANDIPNSFYINQYDNPANSKAHYQTTGPEIWIQTDGKVTHFVVGVGTGGTISGVGKFLKEQNPEIQILGIDTYGSVFKKYHETGIFDEQEIYPYITEGIGEDILPKNVNFDIIDHFEKVTDKDAAIMTRRIAREEGIFVGNSAGSAVAGLLQMKDRFGPNDVVVVLFHDHGSRYVGKMFNDDWMRDRGFLEARTSGHDLIQAHIEQQRLITVEPSDQVSKAMDLMTQHSISQVPVMENGTFVGSITDSNLFNKVIETPTLRDSSVSSIMDDPFQILEESTSIEEISAALSNGNVAVLLKSKEKTAIFTKQDVVNALA